MVTRAIVLGASFALATAITALPARADSPKLVEARRAVQAVDYDAARRLLLEALRDGGNSPAAVGEIYRLLARASVVLGDRDVAEQYYRRWLAIDPTAALPADTAPKLRDPFIAAQAYIAAHGRLVARAERTATGEIEVELVADPLAMARAATALDPATRSTPAPDPATRSTPAPDPATRSTPAPFGTDRRARLPSGARVAILDDTGNRLLELDVAAASSPSASSSSPSSSSASSPSASSSSPSSSSPSTSPTGQTSASETPEAVDDRPWTRHWLTWAVPAGAFGLVSAGFGIAAIASYQRAGSITSDSGKYFLADAEDNARRGKTFVWVTIGAGALTLAFGIPTAIFYLQQHKRLPAFLVPTASNGHVGASVVGRF